MKKFINKTTFLNIKNLKEFNHLALKIFNYQFENCKVYRSYCDLMNINSSDIKYYQEIPFLLLVYLRHQK